MLWGFVVAYFVISATTAFSSIQNKQIAIDKCVAEYKGELDKTQENINQSNADKIIVSDITNSTTSSVNDKIAENFPELCKKRENVRIGVFIGVSVILTLLAVSKKKSYLRKLLITLFFFNEKNNFFLRLISPALLLAPPKN
jgi:hypothetical protein